MSYQKKLIEVAVPLEALNKACKEDKDRKTGTIRNLHKWFAPMPSPAWRVLLAAALLDDPGDSTSRTHLLDLLESLLVPNSDVAFADALIEVKARLGAAGDLPTVFDPFCGGGSTLVEAQRLGLPACGSDLNPIPVLITRLLTAYLPTLAGHPAIAGERQEQVVEWQGPFEGFVLDVSHYAKRIYEEAQRKIGRFFPAGPNGDPIIGWWWARTIQSPDPRFQGAWTPLVNDWWLSKRPNNGAYVRPIVYADAKRIEFEIVEKSGVAPPPSKSKCLYSGAPIPFPYIKQEGKAGRLGTALLAIITHGQRGRHHFVATEDQVSLAESAEPGDPPRLELPAKALGFRVQEYGVKSWDQLFTQRQMLVLETFAELVSQVAAWARADGAEDAYVEALATFLGLCVGKLAQTCSMQVRLFIDSRNGAAKAQPAFSRPDIAPLWDFVEVNPFGRSVGDWLQIVETGLRAIDNSIPGAMGARVEQRDARSSSNLVAAHSALVATDPPYFSNFGYADPSNYFYVWLRRALKDVHPSLFSTLGAPTIGELIADPARHGGDEEAAKSYFIEGLTDTLHGLIGAARPDLPMLVVYAFKQQEARGGQVASTGWEAVLEALVRAGLCIVGTWPIHGTGSARARGLSSNALATYVLLVCRPRPEGAPLATFGEFRDALRLEMQAAVADLRAASIAPVDLAQAVVGPGMGVFTRYSRVVQADGTRLSVREALGMINRVLDEVIEERESEFDAETRWAIAWFEQYGTGPGPYGVADSLSRAKNTAVNGLEKAGLVTSKGGVVRLLSHAELSPEWDPTEDPRLTVWEATHHLIRSLENGGELDAAELLRRLGGFGEYARALTYRLHSISDRKKWAEEALAYNGLAVAWPELARLARAGTGAAQEGLF